MISKLKKCTHTLSCIHAYIRVRRVKKEDKESRGLKESLEVCKVINVVEVRRQTFTNA